jgi:zinc protease
MSRAPVKKDAPPARQSSALDKSGRPGFAYIQSAGGFDEYQLKSNGLRVLIRQDHSLPLVNVMVTYHVGSRNEATGYTGATHLLEHLMFKGSKNFNKQNGNEFWRTIESKGARTNASTWFDRTNYYELIPSEYAEDAIAIEADRMRNAFIEESDRASEMTVVRNEFERGENNPLQALSKAMWSAAFVAHPYHHDTIGWRSDIEKVSIERLKLFYDTFYWPNNATVSLVGDIETSHGLALIKKHFGVHAVSPHHIPEVYTEEPPQEGERRVTVRRAGETRIVSLGYKVPPALSPDTYALEVLVQSLADGKTSRLWSLVDAGKATEIMPSYYPFHDEGLCTIDVFLTPTTKFEDVEKIILREIERVKKRGITKAEVEKAKARVRSFAAFRQDGFSQIADFVNESIAVGDWRFYLDFADKIREVTPADVERVAQKYLVEESRTVGWFVPKKKK